MTKDDYKTFFDMSLDICCIASQEGYFESLNDSVTAILGYSKDTLLSRPFYEFIHPEDVEKTVAEMEQLGQGQPTLHFENRYRHSNGSYLTISWSARQEASSGRIYAIGRDVTEQANTSNRLAQIEKGLKKETIFAQTDSGGFITDVNDKFCDISGYSPEELIGRTHRVINSGHHPKSFFREIWKTISSGQIWSGVIKNRKKNGDYYYVQTIIIPIHDHENRIINYLSIRQDITESIGTEAEKERILNILNETGKIAKVGGWELNVATEELTWTDETFRIFELEKKTGQKPRLPEGLKLYTPECQPIIEQAVSRAIEYGEPYSLELEAQTAKGNVLWVYTNGKPNYHNGKVITLSGTIQDIHARKMAEIKYERERRNNIRNAKLASLGELAASMAHEINNPLGIIAGNAELLKLRHELPAPVNDKIDIIMKSCDRISHIVKGLRRFSRTSENLEFSQCRLAPVILEALSLVSPRLKSERVSVTTELDDTLEVVCREIEIEQVILNLVNNAIDAIGDSQDRRIWVQLQRQNGSIELRVQDSGKGITPEDSDDIFMPFVTHKPQGTGLGLAIVDGILKDHNATITLDENAARTCFIIRFPDPPERADEL